MSFSLVTLILPSIETDYMEEWVSHNLSIGFDQIFIYENGPKSVDRRWNLESLDGWYPSKQSAGNSRSYDQNMVILRDLESRYDEVTLLPWHAPYRAVKKAWKKSRPRQKQVISQLAVYEDAISRHSSDWWMMSDPDEFLWLSCDSLTDLVELQDTEGNLGAMRFHQRVFAQRGGSLPVRSIFNYGYSTFGRSKPPEFFKSLARSPVNTSIHTAGCKDPNFNRSVTLHIEEARVHHYRGDPYTSSKGVDVRDYHQKLYDKLGRPCFNSIDDSMIKYLL